MLAIELSGVHVGQMVEVKYRFPSWPKAQHDMVRRITLRQVEHKANGRVHFNKDDYSAREKFYVNYDAEVTLLEAKDK